MPVIGRSLSHLYARFDLSHLGRAPFPVSKRAIITGVAVGLFLFTVGTAGAGYRRYRVWKQVPEKNQVEQILRTFPNPLGDGRMRIAVSQGDERIEGIGEVSSKLEREVKKTLAVFDKICRGKPISYQEAKLASRQKKCYDQALKCIQKYVIASAKNIIDLLKSHRADLLNLDKLKEKLENNTSSFQIFKCAKKLDEFWQRAQALSKVVESGFNELNWAFDCIEMPDPNDRSQKVKMVVVPEKLQKIAEIRDAYKRVMNPKIKLQTADLDLCYEATELMQSLKQHFTLKAKIKRAGSKVWRKFTNVCSCIWDDTKRSIEAKKNELVDIASHPVKRKYVMQVVAIKGGYWVIEKLLIQAFADILGTQPEEFKNDYKELQSVLNIASTELTN